VRKLASTGGGEGFSSLPREGSSTVVGRAFKFVSSRELRSKNFISDNAVINCNKLFWLKNDNGKVSRMWNIGKEIGFSLLGEEEIVINVEPSDVQALKNPNPLKDVEGLVVLVVAELF